MRSFAQDVSNFGRTNDPMRWSHYRGQKAREKDDRKYLSFFLSLSIKHHTKIVHNMKEAKAGKKLAEELVFPLISKPAS